MLMVPLWDDRNTARARFYSVTNNKVLDFELSFPYCKRIFGSSFGWLISVDNELAITLFNPFSGVKIRLPPVICLTQADFTRMSQGGDTTDDLFLKAILFADPSYHPNEFVVMVILGRRRMLAFIRPGGGSVNKQRKRWFHYHQLCGFCDVIYSKSRGVFYALNSSGQVFMIDTTLVSFVFCAINRSCQFITIDTTKVTDVNALNCFLPSLEPESPCQFRYIVEAASGDLLQILLYTERDVTQEFRVFKLDFSCSPIPYWVELKSLGEDQVLFLGDGSSSLSVKASDFPGCRPGSIYFSLPFPHPWLEVPNDMGCVNLQSRQQPIKRFHISYEYINCWAAINNAPPIWVVPTIQEAAGAAKTPDWSLGIRESNLDGSRRMRSALPLCQGFRIQRIGTMFWLSLCRLF